ncbi:MAG: glycosyltransferase family 4 protein [Candidatus Methanomethyliaceae archaeon]
MKVLHWYTNFLGGGGVANAVLGLAQAQACLGVDAAIASAEPQGQPLYEAMDDIRGVQMIRWKPHWRIRFSGLVLRGIPRQTAAALQAFKPDVVHMHGEFNPDNLWVPRLFRCLLVLSPHGAFHPVVLTKSKSWLKKLYFHVASRMLYRHVDAFHALSPAEQNHILFLLPRKTVYCAPQGPNVRVVNQAYMSEEVSCSIRRRGPVAFVFVGRLDTFTKGLDILLDAFAEVLRRHPEIQLRLVLAGPDWCGSMEQLKERVRRLQIEEVVGLTGPLKGKEVSRLFKDADIYVHLSRHEGFPLSIVEALLHGKPAILSDRIGTVSYQEVRSLPHVAVVQPAVEDAASAMTDFVSRLDELSIQARQHVGQMREFFSWHRVARLHVEAYEHVSRSVKKD